MRSRTIAALVLAGAALLAACGQAASGATNSTPSSAQSGRSVSAVHVSTSPLGDILVDGNGRTLYGFTKDMNGMSSCNGACAQIWPPFEVSASWKPSTNAGTATFHTVMRSDGHLQLAAGKWPLYYYAGDRAAGDVNGQGVESFFAVKPNGTLLKNTTPTTTPQASYSSGY
jgi:predicted lipoprotein with Yx(FWY)xxD motif